MAAGLRTQLVVEINEALDNHAEPVLSAVWVGEGGRVGGKEARGPGLDRKGIEGRDRGIEEREGRMEAERDRGKRKGREGSLAV